MSLISERSFETAIEEELVALVLSDEPRVAEPLDPYRRYPTGGADPRTTTENVA